jgi:uncharacterized membrane protein YsdA (DUF1294 family)
MLSMTKLTLFLFAYAIINLVAFGFMKADKVKAERKQWRIQEKTLFLIAAMGGALGIFSGMTFLRHKTKTWYFVYGIPLLMIVNVASIYFLFPYLK